MWYKEANIEDKIKAVVKRYPGNGIRIWILDKPKEVFVSFGDWADNIGRILKEIRWAVGGSYKIDHDFEISKPPTPDKRQWKKVVSSYEKCLGMKRMFGDEILVNVENSAGTERIGTDPKGKEWRIKMKYDYGFIFCITGADEEGLDVYLGANQEPTDVYIVHQNNPDTGEYDEDKIMLGFNSEKEAKEAYLEHYDSEDFFGSMTTISYNEFKDIVKSGEDERVKWKIKPKK